MKRRKGAFGFGRSRLAQIIRMEFRLTAANKAFVILTILGPFLLAAVTVLPTFLATRGGVGGGADLTVAVVNAEPRFLESIRGPLAQNRIRVFEAQGSPESLDAQVLAGAFDGYIAFPEDPAAAARLQYVSKNVSDFRVMGVLQGVIGQSVVALRLVQAGLPPESVPALVRPPEIATRQLAASGQKESRDFLSVLMTGLTLGMLLYMTVLLYGQTIGRSVLTEKTSKTVEIMLSSVRPMELLFGKILGKAAASILQYGIWVSVTALFLSVAGPKLGIGISLGGNLATLAFLVLYFLLAFFLYCSLFAALGAASQDEQHLGQLSWPLIIFLVVPIVMISPIIGSPDSPLIVALSLFPLTSSVVMFIRIVAGAAETWEILASIGILLVAIAGAVALSAKVFRVGLLMTGKRFKLGEILRWLRA
jgi:ABC-2 type transport system permease protein